MHYWRFGVFVLYFSWKRDILYYIIQKYINLAYFNMCHWFHWVISFQQLNNCLIITNNGFWENEREGKYQEDDCAGITVLKKKLAERKLQRQRQNQRPAERERERYTDRKTERKATVWPKVIKTACFPGDKLLIFFPEDTSNGEQGD